MDPCLGPWLPAPLSSGSVTIGAPWLLFAAVATELFLFLGEPRTCWASNWTLKSEDETTKPGDWTPPISFALPMPRLRQTKSNSHRIVKLRQSHLSRFRKLIASGLSGNQAARRIGINRTTLLRWANRVATTGTPELRFSPGRPCLAQVLGITERIIDQVRSVRRHCRSAREAWLAFSSDPGCPPALAKSLHRLARQRNFSKPMVRLVSQSSSNPQHAFAV